MRSSHATFSAPNTLLQTIRNPAKVNPFDEGDGRYGRVPGLRRSSPMLLQQTMLYLADAVHSGGTEASHHRCLAMSLRVRFGKVSSSWQFTFPISDIRHTSARISALPVRSRGI